MLREGAHSVMANATLPDSQADSASQKKLLERFVTGNDDLEQLERLLSQFNIFEAMGAQRQELRHSDFLAFLLNPRQPHGLQDTFMRQLLRRTLSGVEKANLAIDLVDVDTWDFDGMLVLREWANIDILLLDEPHRLAVIIENKIDTTEHSDQLRRYWQTVGQHYPGWRRVGLYLTPDGAMPSFDDYIPIDYGLVCAVIESIESTNSSTLGPDVLVALKHYTGMLRRDIMPESEIAELCRRIYERHQRALDLIFEYRPDRQAIIHEIVQRLVEQTDGLTLDDSPKRFVRFCPSEWAGLQALSGAKGWTSTERALLFEFDTLGNDLRLKLILGPAPLQLRQHYFEVATSHQPPFKPLKRLTQVWTQLYHHIVLSAQALSDMTADEMEASIATAWQNALTYDIPEMTHLILANLYPINGDDS